MLGRGPESGAAGAPPLPLLDLSLAFFSFLGLAVAPSAGAASSLAFFSFLGSAFRTILGKPSYTGSKGFTGGSIFDPAERCDMCEK